MQSVHDTTNYGTVLPQDDDILYEVVDDQIVELGPMGAHDKVAEHFRLPLAALFEDIEVAKPPQHTAS
jgi:hypothetical protein